MGQGMGQGTPAMRYGGPTPQDFKAVGAQMMKQYKKGGKTEGFDTSNTEAYIQNLKGAISNWVTTNNKLGLIKKRTEDNLALFDEVPEQSANLPRANNGLETAFSDLEIKREDYDAAQKAYSDGTATKEQKDLVNKVTNYASKFPEPAKPANTNTGTGGSSATPMQGESYAQWATRTNQPYGGQYSDKVWDGTKFVGTGQSQPTQHYFPGQESEYGRSLSGKSYRPTGAFGSSVTDIAEQLRNRNYQPFIKGIGNLSGANISEVQARLKEVLSDPNKYQFQYEDIHRKGMFGREKKGKRNIIGQRIIWNPLTGQAEPQPLTEDQQKIQDSKAMPQNWNNVDDNKDNIPDYLQQGAWNSAETESRKPSIAPGEEDVEQLKKDLKSSDPWLKKRAEEYFASNEREQKLQKPGVSTTANVLSEAEALLPAPQFTDEELGVNQMVDIQPESFGGNFYNERLANENQMARQQFDIERGSYAQGGELTGGIIWDMEHKRFKKMPAFFAQEGMETVVGKSPLDWDNIADNAYSMLSNVNEKKRLLNNLTSSDEAAEARAGMFNAITPRSEGRGLYNTLSGDFVSDRTGNQVRPGTGDQSVFGAATNNIFEDLNPGGVNLFSKNGGVLKYAQNGIELNQEYDLSEEDINELMPYLQTLGLKIEKL